MSKFNAKLFGLLLGPFLFAFVYFFADVEGLNPHARAVLACVLWIAVYWITEAIPIAATGLLPIVLFPLTGALPMA